MKAVIIFSTLIFTLSCANQSNNKQYLLYNNNLEVRYQRVNKKIKNTPLEESDLFKALTSLRAQNAKKNCRADSASLKLTIKRMNVDTVFRDRLGLLCFEDSLMFLMEEKHHETKVIFNKTIPYYIKHYNNQDQAYYKIYNLSFDSTAISSFTVDGDFFLTNEYKIDSNEYLSLKKIRPGLIDSNLLKGHYWMYTNGKKYKYRLENIPILNKAD